MKKGVIALFHQKWVRALILAQLQLILAEMTTDYLLFIHGVNVRETGYSQTLFNLIKEKSPSSLPLKRIELFWGKVVETELNKLRGSLEQSQVWPRFWFKHFRSKEIFNFAGDLLSFEEYRLTQNREIHDIFRGLFRRINLRSNYPGFLQ